MNEMNLADLRAKAEAATPGEWEAGDVWVFTDPIYDDDLRLSNVLGMMFADQERAAAEHERGLRNAQYIAAANPQTVLALLDVIAERDATIAAAMEHASQTHPDYDNAAATCQVLAASDASALAERDRAVAERAWGEVADWLDSEGLADGGYAHHVRSHNRYAKE